MTFPQMMALSALCFLAMVFFVAPLICCKGNKNHYLVNISYCVGHPDPRERAQESRDVMLVAEVRQRKKNVGEKNPLVKGSLLDFHLLDSLWLSENLVC